MVNHSIHHWFQTFGES